jgi:predicted glycosyltransferase
MSHLHLSPDTRDALCSKVGRQAGHELAELLLEMARRMEELERTKVTVTHIVPTEDEDAADRSAVRKAA